MTKVCVHCGVEKDFDEFNNDSIKSDGKMSWCKSCKKLRRKSDPEKYRSQKRSYLRKDRATNPDKYRNRAKRYRDRNKSKTSERNKHYYEVNRHELKVKAKERRMTVEGTIEQVWYRLNRRTINGSHADWKNPNHKRYLLKGVRLELHREQLAEFIRQSWSEIERIRSLGETPSIDRIDPDGHYSLDNIRIISLRENCRLSALTTHKKLQRSKPTV